MICSISPNGHQLNAPTHIRVESYVHRARAVITTMTSDKVTDEVLHGLQSHSESFNPKPLYP